MGDAAPQYSGGRWCASERPRCDWRLAGRLGAPFGGARNQRETQSARFRIGISTRAIISLAVLALSRLSRLRPRSRPDAEDDDATTCSRPGRSGAAGRLLLHDQTRAPRRAPLTALGSEAALGFVESSLHLPILGLLHLQPLERAPAHVGGLGDLSLRSLHSPYGRLRPGLEPVT